MKLNKDQQKATQELTSWYNGNQSCAVLEGRGGVGKSFTVKHLLELLGCKALLLAPTHQALRNLEASLGSFKKNDLWILRTVDSALGIHPTTKEKEAVFKQVCRPENVWKDIDLVIVDESSMLSKWKHDLLIDAGKKVLFLGHRAQLADVVKQREWDDLCIPYVFQQGYVTSELHIPQRNIGEGWHFCNKLEELTVKPIKNQSERIPATFDVSDREVYRYLRSPEGILDIHENRVKVVCWRNMAVDMMNNLIRWRLFGKHSVNPYCEDDKLILVEPLTVIDNLPDYNETYLSLMAGNRDITRVYSNTHLAVVDYTECVVTLNPFLTLPVYRVQVILEGENRYIFVLQNEKDYGKIDTYYNHQAYGVQDTKERAKTFAVKFFILSCFASVKYFYAATAYRLQGSTIDKVILAEGDINKNPCLVDQAKTRYVAASRHKEGLMVFRDNICPEKVK